MYCTCEYCGDSFQAERVTARFCSTKCRVKFNREQKRATTQPTQPAAQPATGDEVIYRVKYLVSTYTIKIGQRVVWVKCGDNHFAPIARNEVENLFEDGVLNLLATIDLIKWYGKVLRQPLIEPVEVEAY